MAKRYSSWLSILFLGLVPWQSVQAATPCESETMTHQQCTFTSPALQHKQTKLIDVKTPLGFAGDVGVACRNGKVQWGEPTCEPVAKDSCNVPATRFFSEGASCTHEAHPKPLNNNQTVTALSDTGTGSIEYRCDNGKLIALSPVCGGKAAVLDNPIKASSSVSTSTQAMLTTQSASSLKTGDHKFYAFFASPPTRSQILRECTQFPEYDSRLVPSATPAPSKGASLYEISCPFERTLTCDQEIVNFPHAGGSYNSRSGEMDLPPTNEMLSELCKLDGFSGLTDTLAISQHSPYIMDNFSATAVCSGKESQCTLPDRLLEVTVTPITGSCTDATFYAQNVKGSKDILPGENVLRGICEGKSFGTLVSAGDYERVYTYGGFTWYDIAFRCGSYTGEIPLQSGCGPTPVQPTGVTVSPQTCDMAHVGGVLVGDEHPTTQAMTMLPSEGRIQEMCSSVNYTVLDNIIETTIVQEGVPTYYYVEAQCSGFTGDKSSCDEDNPCVDLNIEVQPGSLTPHICLADGKCYFDKCVAAPATPTGFCENCVGAKGTFSDSATGNTCVVTAPEMVSGEQKTFAFADTQYNGVATMKCNNASILEASGECFRSCPGGVTLTWKDKNGQDSCSQQVPTGIHVQNDSMNFSSSLAHTGKALFSCDNGNWVNKGSTCQLDCSGQINWGSGIAADGTNKADLCQATVSPIKHTINGNANSVTARTSGSTAYVCNDGKFDLSGSSCNVGCNAQTVSWGGQCRASLPALNHTASAPVSHGSNPSYAFASTISGNATFQCNDGGVVEVSGSCKYVTSLLEGPWSAWTNDGPFYSCTTWTPDPSTINSGQQFTQNRSCQQNQTRGRTIYNVWNDGTQTVNKAEIGTQTITVAQSRLATGTKNIVVGESAGSWSSWQNSGAPYGCSAWSPDVATQPTGQVFKQDRQCSQDQVRTRTIYNVWTDGSTTFKRTESQPQTITVSQTQFSTGVKPPVVTNQVAGNWSAWVDTRSAYACGSWSPDAGTIDAGTPFTQTGQCSKDQSRTRDIYNVYSDGTQQYARTETENQTVPTTSTRSAVGTKVAAVVITGQSYDPWGVWTDSSLPYACGAYSPDPSTVTSGERFTQSASCTKDQERTRNVYNTWSDGSSTFSHVDKETRSVSTTQSRSATGTKVATVTFSHYSYSPWGFWTMTSAPYNHGTWSPATSTVQQGLQFTQYATCTIDERRTRYVYSHYSDGSQQITDTEAQTRKNTNATCTRSAIGTKTTTYLWVESAGARCASGLSRDYWFYAGGRTCSAAEVGDVVLTTDGEPCPGPGNKRMQFTFTCTAF